MKDDGLGDWRIEAVALLAEDMPAAFPGGPSHKAGAPVYLSSVTRHKKYNTIGFITPSATALAINSAHKSALEAKRLRSTIALEDVLTPWGNGKNVAKENLPHLYDFFEHCMIAVILSFQAIEVFANSVIGRTVEKPTQVTLRGKLVDLSSEELQRELTTEYKVSDILPNIQGLPSPKGTKVWEGFIRLKRVRDSTVHLKSHDAYSGKEVDIESLFFQFFNNEPTDYPRLAYNMINYFLPKEDKLRWAEYFSDIVEG